MSEDLSYIDTKHGQVIIIDTADLELVSRHKWWITKNDYPYSRYILEGLGLLLNTKAYLGKRDGGSGEQPSSLIISKFTLGLSIAN